jgi:hypothetical protein
MSNPIRRAFNAHRKVQIRLAGVEISIQRGLNTSSVISATVGFTGETTYDEMGMVTYTKHRDYLVDITDYDFGSGAVAPQRHDIVTEVINGVPVTFEVVSANNDAPANYDNRDRNLWRVHTKEV